MIHQAFRITLVVMQSKIRNHFLHSALRTTRPLLLVGFLMGCELFQGSKPSTHLSSSKVFREIQLPFSVKLCDIKQKKFLAIAEVKAKVFALYSFDAQKKDVTRLTFQKANYECGAWTANGLVFASDRDLRIENPFETHIQMELFELNGRSWINLGQKAKVAQSDIIYDSKEDSIFYAQTTENGNSQVLKMIKKQINEVTPKGESHTLPRSLATGLYTLKESTDKTSYQLVQHSKGTQMVLSELTEAPVDFAISESQNTAFILYRDRLETIHYGKKCPTGIHKMSGGNMNRILLDSEQQMAFLSSWESSIVLTVPLKNLAKTSCVKGV